MPEFFCIGAPTLLISSFILHPSSFPLPPPLPSSLFRERCWTHPEREAAARCPSCGRSFCRECVTEHDGRLICAGCLREQFAASDRRGPARWGRRVAVAGSRTVALTLSLLAAWLFFHLLAQTLISVPSEFHQSTLWQQLGVPTGDDDND